jgi:hypothetical protein
MNEDFTLLEKIGLAAILGVTVAVVMGWMAPHVLAAVVSGGAVGLAWKLFLAARATQLGW